MIFPEGVNKNPIRRDQDPPAEKKTSMKKINTLHWDEFTYMNGWNLW